MGVVMRDCSDGASSRCDLGFAQRVEDLAIEQFVTQTRLKLSMKPFSHGLPGVM